MEQGHDAGGPRRDRDEDDPSAQSLQILDIFRWIALIILRIMPMPPPFPIRGPDPGPSPGMPPIVPNGWQRSRGEGMTLFSGQAPMYSRTYDGWARHDGALSTGQEPVEAPEQVASQHDGILLFDRSEEHTSELQSRQYL